MSIKNIPASLLNAVKDVVQEDRKKFVEEQQLHEKLVAEKMLSPKQKKHIDKNKNGKIDAHDFELLRKEEAEQIDEALPASGIKQKHAGSEDSANEAYTPDLQEKVVVNNLDVVRAIMEARGRPRKDPTAAKWQKQTAKPKADDDEEDDDYEGRAGSPHHSTEPDKHISVQLRVASDMKDEKGGADVKFADGKTHFVKHDVATNVLNGLEKVKPQQRGEIHDHIAQSHDNLMAVHKMIGGK